MVEKHIKSLAEKYVNTAEIITKVTMTLFINSKINIFRFRLKTPCLFYFRSKVSPCQRNTHDASNLLANAGENFCSMHLSTKDNETNLCQDWFVNNLKTPTDLKVHALHYANLLVRTCFSKTLANSQTNRNNKKLSKTGFGYDKALIGKLTN